MMGLLDTYFRDYSILYLPPGDLLSLLLGHLNGLPLGLLALGGEGDNRTGFT